MSTKKHTWTEAEAEQLVATLESMRDLDHTMCEMLHALHARLTIAEAMLDLAAAWIEQHKVEAAAFKAEARLKHGDLPPTYLWVEPPAPMVNGPNVIHHSKWSDIKHKRAGGEVTTDIAPTPEVTTIDLGGES